MKSFRLICSVTLFLLTSFVAFGETQCPGNVVSVQYHSLPHSHIGISIMINGSGPYEFMVDTGAQITVVDPALARELKLEFKGSLNIVTVASHVDAPLVSAAVVEIGPVSVHDIRMAVEDLGSIQAEYPGLRGILGNNFLSRFDLLIDNGHRMLCFDDSGRMQQSLRGEHVPVLSGTGSNPKSGSSEAILVSVHLPDDGKQGSVLRLDSGSNVPLLYVDHQGRASARVAGTTIGKQAQFVYAYTPERNVRLGSQKEMQISFATPAGNSHLYSKTGEDGVLPTTLFKRVFISAAAHFVIFDPH
jgi:gag-polyprotein putative aspartyl protease